LFLLKICSKQISCISHACYMSRPCFRSLSYYSYNCRERYEILVLKIPLCNFSSPFLLLIRYRFPHFSSNI
jgi:hypothetical protein